MIRLKYIIAGISLLLLASCKEADEFRDVVYMTGTESTVISRLTIDGPATMGVSATCSSKIEGTDVKVSFTVEPGLVESYNVKNGTKYTVLPGGSYRLSESQSVIKAGSNVSEPIMFNIDSTEKLQEGVVYMLPISLANVEGKKMLDSGRTLYLIVNQTIITSACSLSGSVSFNVPKFKENPSLKSLQEFSMECRIKMNGFATWDPYISSIMGIESDENFLLRFGDVTIKNNQLQLTAKDQLTTPMTFDTGKWYHVAAVYDGASLNIYVNGALEVTKATDKRKAVNLYDGGDFNIGYSYNGRYLNGAISEARVWTRALTQAEIEGNICYVAPDSEGLLAYWRFNEGTGNTSADMTGHGYNAERKTGAPTWIEGVRCPE